MAITAHKFEATAEIGSTMDFGGFQLIESIMTGELSDGRSVEVFRAASGRPYFEIRIQGEDREMRIDLMNVIQELAGQLGAIIDDQNKSK